MEISKNVIFYSLLRLFVCVIISFFIGYRYANYTTIKYIESNYPTIKDTYDNLQEGDTIFIYSNELKY